MMKRKKLFLGILLAALVLAATACGGGGAKADTIKVTISIDVLTLQEKDPALAEAYGEDGVVLSETELELPEGSNVIDALTASEVAYDDAAGYVSSIAGLQSGTEGSYSGWLFIVNDEFADVGATDYILSDGDKIQWRFSLDGGSDIGAPW
jgi:hypothetical protein